MPELTVSPVLMPAINWPALGPEIIKRLDSQNIKLDHPCALLGIQDYLDPLDQLLRAVHLGFIVSCFNREDSLIPSIHSVSSCITIPLYQDNWLLIGSLVDLRSLVLGACRLESDPDLRLLGNVIYDRLALLNLKHIWSKYSRRYLADKTFTLTL
jgi:hypothetical protein